MLRLRDPACADGLGGGGLSRGDIGKRRRRRRHLVRHLRHEGAEADHDGGKDHEVTHHATPDEVTQYHHAAANRD